MTELEADATASSVSATYRVTAVLYALTEPGEGLSVRAVAERTATSRSAAHRILQALVDEGYAVQGAGGRYVAGPKLLQLAARAFTGTSAIQLADSIMNGLVDEVGETAYLGSFLPEEKAVTFVHRVECTHPLRYIQPLGVPLPLDRGAIGKAILADAVKNPDLGIGVDAGTELAKDLEEIRERRYAVSFAERVQGVTGIASAVHARGMVVGGLTLAVPTVRLPRDQIGEIGEIVVRYADQISGALAALGSRGF